MKYYSGLLALSQYANEDEESIGLGEFASEYLRDVDKYIRDSEEALMGEDGIFLTDIIPTGVEAFCASHARAYCDMLIEHKFEDLAGLYQRAINNYGVISKVFDMLKKYALFKDKDILRFLNSEFGSYFRGYLVTHGADSVLSDIMEG